MITDEAMEVHFGLGLPDMAADHAFCHNYSYGNQAVLVKQLEQEPQIRIHEVYEARLCGPSLSHWAHSTPSSG